MKPDQIIGHARYLFRASPRSVRCSMTFVARSQIVGAVRPVALREGGGHFLLGVLDLYVATVSRWSPHRGRFYREAPTMAEVVRRIDADPRLANVWETRFPFCESWEG